jgi:EmrB/QacA subfamily drug resistance transporter
LIEMRRAGKLLLRVFPSIMLPMFLAVADQTIVAASLPAIAASLGNVGRVSWIVVVYLVASTIAAPVYGQLRDVAGGRRMMFIGLTIFITASMFCAAAISVEMLILARILQGLGGGGLMTLSQALIGETIPPRERARYQGYLAAVMVSSNTFGPIAGGYLTQHFGWRSVFLINLPIGLIALLLTMRLKAKQTSRQDWAFDWLGLLLFVMFLAPVLLALGQLQQMTSGSVASCLVCMAVGAVSFVLLLRHEKRSQFPLIPIELLRNPIIWRSNTLAACHGATIVSLVTFLPIYFRAVLGTSAAETGILLLPLLIGIGMGSMATGRMVSRTGRTMIFPSLGLIFVSATLLFLGIQSTELSVHKLNWLLFANGLFMGTVMGVVQVTVQRAAGPYALGAAAASVQLFRSVGAAVGTALVGMVLFAALVLIDPQARELFDSIVEQGPSIIATLPQDRQVIIRTEVAFAFRGVFSTIAAFSTAGIILAWIIPARRI